MIKQIKSKERVRDFAEVFTAEREVKAMCDLIPAEIWENIESTYLEPSCGTGNFLVEIFTRKLTLCKDEKDGLKALASIVGIDILSDNCEESRRRLLRLYRDKFPNASDFAVTMAVSILNNNIICGDSLKIMKRWEYEGENRPNRKRNVGGCMTEKEKAKIIYEAKLEMLAEFEKKIKGYYYWIKGGTPAALVAYHVGVVADEIREKMEDEFYGTKTD